MWLLVGRGYKKTGLYRLLSLDIAPFPSIIVQATGQKAEAGTLLEDLPGCAVLVGSVEGHIASKDRKFFWNSQSLLDKAVLLGLCGKTCR